MKKLQILIILLFFWSIIHAQTEDFSFVFFTDVHMDQSVEAHDGFTKAVADINKIAPDFAIQGGDFLMDMNHKEWDSIAPDIEVYNIIASELRCPVYNTIGNHDVAGISKRSSLKQGDPHFGKNYFLDWNDNQTYYCFTHKGCTFFILDCVQHSKNNFANYTIDSIQQSWIKKRLLEVPSSSPIVVVSHAPFISSTAQLKSGGLSRNSSSKVLSNGNDIKSLFKDHNLKLFLAGHLHIYEKIEISDIIFVTGGAVSGFWWKGPMDNTPNGFVQIDVIDGNFNVKYQPL